METQNNSAHSIKWGIILGAVGVLIILLSYLIDISLLTSGWISAITIISYIAIVFYASFDYRKQLGGYMSFGQAFLHAFVLMAIAGILDIIFRYLLFNVIDPEAAKFLADAQMEATMEAMEAFGGSPNAEMMDKMAEGFENQYSIGTMAMGYATTLIFYAIGASIVGLITRKKNKEELDF